MIKLSQNGQLPLPVGCFIILLQPTQLIAYSMVEQQ